jgi:(2R)-ethylmalonyl-CoA mutase
MPKPKDRPWLIRTYAGHSSATSSNALYRRNLAKGQTGLSVAFDLPTQTGYDPDSVMARGEVGKVGVPVSHLGNMRQLFDQIPLGEMNTRRSRGPLPSCSRALRRTTSSRNTCRAAPTCSRRRRRCA